MTGNRKVRRSRGAAVVEFALVMPIFLTLVFGIIQYGWYFYAMQSGTSATGDALRRLAVGACQSQSQRDSFITSDLGPALAGSLTSDSVTYKDTSGNTTSSAPPSSYQGGSVTLTVTFPTMYLHFPFILLPGGGTVSRTQTARIEQTSSTGTCP